MKPFPMISRRLTIAWLTAAFVVTSGPLLSTAAQAAPAMDSIHFLIPGGAGGGWDGTARGTGEALTKSGLVGKASYQNLSGGGGGKAIAHLIETAEQQKGTLMVNSTPIVVRSLTGVFPHSGEVVVVRRSDKGDFQVAGTIRTD